MPEKGEHSTFALPTIVRIWDGVRWVILKVPYGRSVLFALRKRRDADQFKRLNTGVFHSMRVLAVAMSRKDWDENAIVGLANDLCTEFNDMLIQRLDHEVHDLHCCWKTLTPSPNRVVTTFAKSRPFDEGRPKRQPHAFSTEHSTICAALMGGDDGKTRWGKFPCFCVKQPSEVL